MLKLAASNSPVSVAWSAYDAAMLQLQSMYVEPAQAGDTPALRAQRVRKAEQVASLWENWRDLFLTDAPARQHHGRG